MTYNQSITPITGFQLLQTFPELKPKWETSVLRVVENRGAAYLHPDKKDVLRPDKKDVLISLYSLGIRDHLFLYTPINLHPGGVISINPSTVSMPSHINDFSKFLDVSLEDIMEIVPEMDKRAYTRTLGSVTNLERLQTLTEKGKYWFHSAKGRNFLATKIGVGRQGKPRYRLYEVLAEQGKALTLVSPIP
jgi:hypothetical protein